MESLSKVISDDAKFDTESSERPVFFKIDDEVVFDTSLATLQLSPKL
ncbi:hypothetical protein [Candidatus Burkholderia verschuerenii]|nr:hypothetical protein [Candidatus Burkholderia verschuerenii]